MSILLIGIILFLLLVSCFRAHPVASVLGVAFPFIVIWALISIGHQ
jgi:hypothetical protein